MTAPDPSTTLALIDDALEAGRVTADGADERELQELALVLEADAPEPDPEFAAELEALVREGFPSTGRRVRVPAFIRRLPRPRVRRRPLLAAAAASLVLVSAVTVALTTDESGRDGGPAGREPLSEVPSRDAAGSAEGSPGGMSGRLVEPPADTALSTPVPPNGGTIEPGESERRIERSAEMTLAAPAGELERVADEIVAIADRRRGFVLRSEVRSGDEGSRGGEFDLRVPVGALQATLRDLSDLADVRARSQSGQDITPAYVSVRDRLDAARAERRSLLRRLRRATDDDRAARLRDRLMAVSAEVRRTRAELRALQERTNYAAVKVELEPKEGSADSGDNGVFGGGAFDDAGDSLVGAANFAVRVLGVALPLALVGALFWLTALLVRRRRREAALS